MDNWAAVSREAVKTLTAAAEEARPEDGGPCPHCGGKGWVFIADGGAGTARECDCRKASRGERVLAAAGIPERYRRYRLDSFTTTDQDKGLAEQLARALAMSRAYVDGFLSLDEDSDRKFIDWGLIYVGPAGVGKTHLAAAVTMELVRRYQVRARFVEFTELIHRIHATFDSDNPESKSRIVNPLIEAELLVLDELGAQKTTAFVLDLLYLIINGRYTRRLPTLFTTNYSLEISSARPEPGGQAPTDNATTTGRRGKKGDEKTLDRGADEPPSARGLEPLADRLPAKLISRLYEMARPVILDAVADYRHEVKFNRHRPVRARRH